MVIICFKEFKCILMCFLFLVYFLKKMNKMLYEFYIVWEVFGFLEMVKSCI